MHTYIIQLYTAGNLTKVWSNISARSALEAIESVEVGIFATFEPSREWVAKRQAS